MAEFWQAFSDARVVAALVAAAVALFINTPTIIWSVVRNAQNNRKLKELSHKHDIEIVHLKHEHGRSMAELQSSLDLRRAVTEQKIKDREAARQKERSERRELIENLHRLLDKVDATFLKRDLDLLVDDEELIVNARQAFEVYAQLSTAVKKLKGKIKREDYKSVSEVLEILSEICLDLTRDKADRNSPDRRGRLKSARARLEAYIDRSEAAFEKALVPWSDEVPVSAAKPNIA